MELKGIDVSSYHGKIKWDKVRENVDFAIIRAGWSNTEIDPMFRKNIEDAIKAGLQVGIYWYLYGKNTKDIQANAKKCREIIEPYRRFITMGVWGVWNSDSDTYLGKRIAKTERTAYLKAFLEAMKGYGYDVGYYADSSYVEKFSFFSLSDYPLWLSYFATAPNEKYPCLIWQNNCHGKIDGVVTRVDLDTCFGDIKDYNPKFEVKFSKPLSIGSGGDKIVMIKSLLSERGYEITNMGAKYEGSTYEAVKKFQEDNGLDVTGTVDKITWDLLTGGLNG